LHFSTALGAAIKARSRKVHVNLTIYQSQGVYSSCMVILAGQY
jgi:hypothetical protein